jgi:hypothetical protein
MSNKRENAGLISTKYRIAQVRDEIKMMSMVKSAKAQLRTKTPRIYETLY